MAVSIRRAVMELVKFTIEYDNKPYDMYGLSGDERTNLVRSRNGTQEGKVNTFKEIVDRLQPENVLDVGANYGEFLFPICSNDTKIWAFEPINNVYECLSKTFNDFYPNNNVQLENIAISNSDRNSVMHIPNSSGNSSLDINYVKYKNQVKTQPVVERDISNYITNLNHFVMKIDVEGLEYKILDKIKDIDNFDWYCIMFEFNRFSGTQNDVIEEFLDGKEVQGISAHRVKLSNDTFFTYKKSVDFAKIKSHHDVIVTKNIDWSLV
jgi:FkbM family methyltransferase